MDDQTEKFLISRMCVGFIFHKDHLLMKKKKVSSFWSWLGIGLLSLLSWAPSPCSRNFWYDEEEKLREPQSEGKTQPCPHGTPV